MTADVVQLAANPLQMTGLKLAANSLPIPQLPIHSLEVCCQFVSFKKLINLFQPLKRLPYTIAKTVSCHMRNVTEQMRKELLIC